MTVLLRIAILGWTVQGLLLVHQASLANGRVLLSRSGATSSAATARATARATATKGVSGTQTSGGGHHLECWGPQRKGLKGTKFNCDQSNHPSHNNHQKSCTVLPLLVYTADYVAAQFENAAGFGSSDIPLYNPETLVQIGYYSDFALNNPDVDDCVVSAAFSFDWNSNTGFYDSQINTASTCLSEYTTIVGGSGTYGCANGYQVDDFMGENDEMIGVELHLCGALCPIEPVG